MNGHQHTALTLTVAAVTAPAMFAAGADVLSIARFSGGMLITVLIGPDLDVDEGNISIDYMRRIFPPLVFVWQVLWFPYAKIMRHRGISHFPVIGTFSRIAYILLIVWGIQAILRQPLFVPDLANMGNWIIFGGMAFSDLFHWISDMVSTKIKMSR